MLHGAFAVLEELARLEEAGLTQLAMATGLPKTTTHRLLGRLADLGVVHREDGGRYRIGARTFRWGQRWAPGQVLGAAAVRPLRRLAAAGGSAVVVVRDGDDVIVVAGIADPAVDQVLRLRPGVALPATGTAEVMLAAWDPASAVPPPGRSGPQWRPGAARSRRVDDATARRIAVGFEATPPPLGCVAAPVRAPTGALVAAAALVVLGTGRLPSLADAVRDAAARISANLTGVPGAGRALSPLTGR
ncbi:helix-turn-helix domain-containing protein [Thermopolyspora sp. NPDC052614]|uniref:helix-turn-helix domain-containing protein n=1 Tax=Thermopolyspora sp. NPDC052614 TaxID=3155682 RepID=UPI0034208E9C